MNLARFAGAALVGCALLSACSSERMPDLSAASCKLPPAIDRPKDLSADVPIPDVIEITRTKIRKKFVIVDGFAKTTVKGLFDSAAETITEAKFDIINTDYEGFEAEIYFARAASIAGIARLREGPCDGYVSLNLLYDPLETEEGKKAVKKTRDLTNN